MQNKFFDMSEQTPQIYIYSTTELNSAKIGITISKELLCLILIEEYPQEPH